MSTSRRILFVPVSGPAGSGEYERCRVLASGLAAADRAVESAFVISREAPVSVGPYAAFPTARSPTYCTAEVRAILDRYRPDVAVFDNAGRTVQLRHAKSRGARVVFVSRTPGKRAKAFRPQWVAALAEHWILFPDAMDPRPSRWEAAVARLFGPVDVRFFGALFRPSTALERREVLRQHGLTAGQYVLYTLGGGRGALEASAVFVEAARRVGYVEGVRHIVLSGSPEVGTQQAGPAISILPRVPADHVTCLVHDAAAVVCNGGSTLFQVLAHDRPAVAIPAMDDQHARVRAHAAAGTVVPCELDAPRIASEVLRLLRDPAATAALRSAREQYPIRNGFDEAVAALLALLRPAEASARE